MRNLGRVSGFDPGMVEELAQLPGVRNVLLHEYVGLDYDLVVRALHHLDPIHDLATAAAERLLKSPRG